MTLKKSSLTKIKHVSCQKLELFTLTKLKVRKLYIHRSVVLSFEGGQSYGNLNHQFFEIFHNNDPETLNPYVMGKARETSPK